jgi:hypothetical protein
MITALDAERNRLSPLPVEPAKVEEVDTRLKVADVWIPLDHYGRRRYLLVGNFKVVASPDAIAKVVGHPDKITSALRTMSCVVHRRRRPHIGLDVADDDRVRSGDEHWTKECQRDGTEVPSLSGPTGSGMYLYSCTRCVSELGELDRARGRVERGRGDDDRRVPSELSVDVARKVIPRAGSRVRTEAVRDLGRVARQ